MPLYIKCWNKAKDKEGHQHFLVTFQFQAGRLIRWSWGKWSEGSCGTMLGLPFPPCVALTVQTAAQRASQQDRQDRHRLERDRRAEHAVTLTNTQFYSSFQITVSSFKIPHSGLFPNTEAASDNQQSTRAGFRTWVNPLVFMNNIFRKPQHALRCNTGLIPLSSNIDRSRFAGSECFA